MPLIESSVAYSMFQREGRNSSHFVWFLADLRFFQSASGWVFGFQQVGSVTLMALEPLIPRAPTEYDASHLAQFTEAWAEFQRELKPRIVLFAGIYEPFRRILEASGFQGMKVGEEPWVDLSDCIPRGNAGKGVRSARNQALSAGLTVEEWAAALIHSDTEKKKVLLEIHQDWAAERLISLGGFMNATDPFAHAEDRRYFILRSPKRVEAYLVASPVPGIQSYFLEDLVLRRQPPRGSGELLTLEAMTALGQSGAREASLGVISMNSLREGASSVAHLPWLIRLLAHRLPSSFDRIYNFKGMEIYRKRFKPRRWQSIHLCLHDAQAQVPGTRAWLRALLALLIAFRPRLQLTPTWLARAIARPLLRYPLTAFFALTHFLGFALINHFGELPKSVLERWGFAGNTPFSEWIPRSIVSDFLYFNPEHFWALGTIFCLMVHWAERRHKIRFLLPYLAAICVFDDLFNQVVLIKPFQYFQPALFSNLVAAKDVGSSLGLSTLIGLQLHQLRKLREPLFVLGMLGLLLSFAFSSAQHHALVMNLDHVLFLVVGYMTGKVLFERSRHRSRKMARGESASRGGPTQRPQWDGR